MNSIIQCRTVNLYKCRDKVFNKKEKQSLTNAYVRLVRFFKMKHIEEFILGIRSMIMDMTEIDLTYLVMDRSNWKRGTKNINILTIGNLMQNTFLPLHWKQLNKRGNSNLDDRRALIAGLAEGLGKYGKSISGSILLADREFIGQQWFEFLLTMKISFVIRLREKMYFELQTVTGKKNFVKVVQQTNRTLWNFQHTNGFRGKHLCFCND